MNDNLDIYYLSGYDILKKMITNLKFEKNIRVKDFKFKEYSEDSVFLINSAYIDFLKEFIKRHNERTYIYSHGFSYYSYMKTETLGANYFYIIDDYEIIKEFLTKLVNLEEIDINRDKKFLSFEDMELIKYYTMSDGFSDVAEKFFYSQKGLSSKFSRIYKRLGIRGFNQLYMASIKRNLFSRDDFLQYLFYTNIS